MGIPIWKPTKQLQRPALHRTQQHSIVHHPLSPHRQPHHPHPHFRLHRSRRTSVRTEPYSIATDDGYTTTQHTVPNALQHPQQQVLPLQRHPHHHIPAPSIAPRTRLQHSPARMLEIERQIELRLFEKQELWEQLNITTSLLDQFISIREMSGQEMALSPFITDNLLSILTATSATLNHPSSSSIPNNIHHNNSNNNTSPTTIYRALRSNGRSASHPTLLSRQVDNMIESPPYASRLEELELNIASAHRKVSNQLNQLGASLILPANLPSPTQSSAQLTSRTVDPHPSA